MYTRSRIICFILGQIRNSVNCGLSKSIKCDSNLPLTLHYDFIEQVDISPKDQSIDNKNNDNYNDNKNGNGNSYISH